MTEGKILKWKIQPGESFGVGDALFSIETDKATVDYEATEKGYLAKVIVGNNESFPVGKNVAVVVKNKDLVSQFSDFTEGATQQPTAQSTPSTPAQQPAAQQQTQQAPPQARSSGERVIASPLAKTTAQSKGIDLFGITGSGQNGRILKQDVDAYTSKLETKQEQPKVEQPTESKK